MKNQLWVEKYRPKTIEDCILPENIKKTLTGDTVDCPSKTYPSVPCEIIHAGLKVNFTPVEGDKIKGAYQLSPSNVWDSALSFTADMYIPKTHMCLSFTGPYKTLKLSKGGAIITDDYQAMLWFATAERLIEQHRYDSAFVLFDSIQINFPMHSLADEILFRKGKAMEQQGKWAEAREYYTDLLKFHADDILGDDALFRLADMEETQFQNKEKALEYYKRLMIEFKGSLFSTEARARIRFLRGDANIELDSEQL